MTTNFLLVGTAEGTGWSLILRQAIAALGGELDVVTERDAVARVSQCKRGTIIIVDAGEVADVPALVAHLQSQCPQCYIVVATTSPTWRRAREAFQAGAKDYIRKIWDKERLVIALKDVLDRVSSD